MMKTLKLKLDSIDSIRKFNDVVIQFPCDFDLEQGRYYIDAKSIMGLLSLDLNAPVSLHFQTDSAEEKQIITILNDFMI